MNPATNPTVLIYRSEILPPSETFIAAQAHALRRFSPLFAGLRRIRHGLELDPEEILVLTRGNTLRDRLRRRVFLETGFETGLEIALAPRFFHLLQLHHPVLLHAHFAVDAAAALPIHRHLRLPLVVTLHGYDVTSSDAALRSVAAGRVYLRRREELFARASLFLCVSAYLRRKAIDRGFPESKLRTLPIGVDLSLFAPDPLRSRSRDPHVLDPIVLFVGRLVEVKGCAYLIRAMSAVQQRHPAARLIIVGDGPLLDPLRAQARASAASIVFLGSQPPAVVRDLMYRASVLAAPSIVTPAGNSEALGMVVCEAQAIGLPVAAFRGTGVEEAVADGETALLVPSGDDCALADAISAILSDPAFAARLAAAGRLRAETHFSLAEQTARLEDLYAEVLVSRP
jgi:glycosyltransferase involved in cell wall biosynthesis